MLLSVENLRTYVDTPEGTLRAVDGVSLTLARGETLALLGESGCGKSMAALSLTRLIPQPAARIVGGRVWLGGRDLLALPERELRQMRGRRIAMIFQEPHTSLNPVLTVGAQIMEAFALPLSRTDARARAIELLRRVGIADPQRHFDEYPHRLSGGMKQRIMIAMALAGEPDILIADEPTTALDVTIQAQILELLRDLQRQTGLAILLITHDLGVVAQMADRVAVMYAGHVVEQAPRAQFFADPWHPYSRKLFLAVPARGKRGAALDVIRGAVPALTEPFSGCRFADRCDSSSDLCRTRTPRWIETDGRGVRCHLHDPQVRVPGAAARVAAPAGERRHDDDGRKPAALLEVQDLKVHFPIVRGVFRRVVGLVKAVDGVSLSLAQGRTLALVGESGCGKTTVGKAILQLIRADAGIVRFAGRELTALPGRSLRRLRREFQIVFQDPYSSLDPRMLVGEILEEGMRALGVGGAVERQRKTEELLEHVGLPASARLRYPHEFSGGQRQRICIARALAVDPRLIVCDEPTSALDVSVQAQILNLLKRLQDELGLSYLFISHNLGVVEYLAHDVAVMYLGRIVEAGPIGAVLEGARHPYTQALLSAVPVLEAESRREVIRLSGDIPSPANPPVGCHFHPRCPQATAVCRERYPDAVALGDGHLVRCHLYGSAQ